MVLGETVYTPPAPQYPPRKRWTRDECAAYEQSGLWESQHFELIEGELINKTGKKQPHVFGVRRAARSLRQVFGWDSVFTEAPINVAPQDRATNEREPDLYVLKAAPIEFGDLAPRPSDLALVVEIADTTLNFDLTTKAALYARAGIPEYWVLDLNGRRLIVHRDPSSGVYKSVVAYSDQERVAPLSAPGRELLVADLLAA